ncbi:hypothetical protein HN807_00455 [Candidatus Bathyarchaeota archaeon]|jgi:hypothetical protein|nr:hypothetical protein [Candidatus Bathyarchaeota archaeon]MBT3284627.1 hypothetical protein [Candidatus Bathyarchaeota archaeon]MBT4321037.1 hypothetical protein [Candidatus Bathyarchaeota archaeon]MBT4425083.1 hypothetical protein [Candidatus Bathyarchaeota archaeon]MBT6605860.1 hypothetical protein [Candidatus Bathyarchaeota archaeon]
MIKPKKIIDSISNKKIDTKETISIFGSPRSGTTWIMNVFSALKNYKSIFEPFHIKWYPEFHALNLFPRPYFGKDEQSKELRKYIINLINGNIRIGNTNFRYKETINRIRADKIILKFVRGNRILPWYCNNVPESKINVLLLRHPMSTIQSQIKSGMRGYFKKKNETLQKDVIKKEISKIYEIEHIKEKILGDMDNYNEYEMLALTYGIDNYIPVESGVKIHIIYYEDVFSNGLSSIYDVLNNNRIEYENNRLERELGVPSQTTHKDTEKEFKNQLSKWTSSNEMKVQEERIRNILHLFEIDFNNKSYSILENKITF